MNRSFESLMVEQCAPTLTGIKPASLFRCGRRAAEDIRQTVETWDHALRHLGLRVRILKECPNTGDCMIYVYRPDWVDRLLSEEDHLRFLDSCGYQRGSTARSCWTSCPAGFVWNKTSPAWRTHHAGQMRGKRR